MHRSQVRSSGPKAFGGGLRLRPGDLAGSTARIIRDLTDKPERSYATTLQYWTYDTDYSDQADSACTEPRPCSKRGESHIGTREPARESASCPIIASNRAIRGSTHATLEGPEDS